MPAPIGPIAPILPPASAAAPAASATASPAFADVFRTAVSSVDAASQAASASVQSFLSGEGGELHTAILATQRAELSFDLFLQMRNKVVSAYQEIMRMQM
jgi:flagellar hook-basal body complex protein FliE